MTFATASFGQTTKPKLEAVKNDPATSQNAAKADVQVVNNKNVADSSTLKTMMIKRKDQRLKRKKDLPRKSS